MIMIGKMSVQGSYSIQIEVIKTCVTYVENVGFPRFGLTLATNVRF